MPYTPRCPYIVNKLTFFLEAGYQRQSLLLICYSMTKKLELRFLSFLLFYSVLHCCHFFSGLKDVLCGCFLFLPTLSYVFVDRKISHKIWPKFCWPMRFFYLYWAFLLYSLWYSLLYTLSLSTMTYIFGDPHSQSPRPPCHMPCTLLLKNHLSLRSLDMIYIKLGITRYYLLLFNITIAIFPPTKTLCSLPPSHNPIVIEC
jgi:hypothetical protein